MLSQKVNDAFGQELLQINPDIGFKKLNGYMVKLKLEGKNNEYRQGVADPHWAKFRTEDATCEAIWCLTSNKWISDPVENIFTDNNHETYRATYQAGKRVVYDNKYCLDEHLVCAGGIHYFKTLVAALFYNRFARHIVLWNQEGCRYPCCSYTVYADGDIPDEWLKLVTKQL